MLAIKITSLLFDFLLLVSCATCLDFGNALKKGQFTHLKEVFYYCLAYLKDHYFLITKVITKVLDTLLCLINPQYWTYFQQLTFSHSTSH